MTLIIFIRRCCETNEELHHNVLRILPQRTPLFFMLGGFKCEVQHPSVIEQEAGPWDCPEPERGLVARSASSGFCAGGR